MPARHRHGSRPVLLVFVVIRHTGRFPALAERPIGCGISVRPLPVIRLLMSGARSRWILSKVEAFRRTYVSQFNGSSSRTGSSPDRSIACRISGVMFITHPSGKIEWSIKC